ncbi:hypothetical protein TCAL_15151 [Tigriopus californicus]|uniref:Uncharacterized protein n=1 Tax=Tigriopus californicus TaxID=6832 RepID=A0A553NVT1_TIGCA|nr:hypothetical protein TCAL_15151 [Tigriopus californicus]
MRILVDLVIDSNVYIDLLFCFSLSFIVGPTIRTCDDADVKLNQDHHHFPTYHSSGWRNQIIGCVLPQLPFKGLEDTRRKCFKLIHSLNGMKVGSSIEGFHLLLELDRLLQGRFPISLREFGFLRGNCGFLLPGLTCVPCLENALIPRCQSVPSLLELLSQPRDL